jgi:hypothetical protein
MHNTAHIHSGCKDKQILKQTNNRCKLFSSNDLLIVIRSKVYFTLC